MKAFSGLTTLVLFNILWKNTESKSRLKFIPGSGCGITTPMRKVDKPEESDSCAIVLDETAFNAYIHDKIVQGKGLIKLKIAKLQVEKKTMFNFLSLLKAACTSDSQCQDSIACQQDSCSWAAGRSCCFDLCPDMVVLGM